METEINDEPFIRPWVEPPPMVSYEPWRKAVHGDAESLAVKQRLIAQIYDAQWRAKMKGETFNLFLRVGRCQVMTTDNGVTWREPTPWKLRWQAVWQWLIPYAIVASYVIVACIWALIIHFALT